MLKLQPTLFILLLAAISPAQETHDHPAPEKLGTVSFPISCRPLVQQQFNRAVALLHSFAYATAEIAFQSVTTQDPGCAMAHWGIAMTHFHQLWDPPLNLEAIQIGQRETQLARQIGSRARLERQFIDALSPLYQGATIPYPARASTYEKAMGTIAAENPKNVEAQVFYALALLSNAPPTDRAHANQKQAVAILEPLNQAHPEHPGIPHYLIHACDNAELASEGLPAARAYAVIAPSAPHALHMPSHIFTRLGLWDDSIASNLAAEAAAHQQGDRGEELHAMDYLVYAYLQSGRDRDAAQVIHQLESMPPNGARDFKVTYAATAMPIRYAVERSQWADAAKTVPPEQAPPHVIAIAVWARGLGLARTGHPADAATEVDRLQQLETQLRTAGNGYWATQVGILKRELLAWSAQADGKAEQASQLMREAAEEEDAIEKLPVTPGPILPAREQLGSLLLEQGQPTLALREFQTALTNAPGRRGAIRGAAQATQLAIK
jgi:tetratricopeptide (TPR) repeat protein